MDKHEYLINLGWHKAKSINANGCLPLWKVDFVEIDVYITKDELSEMQSKQ